MRRKRIAVDLDGTLAEWHGWPADGSIGAPIPAMVNRVKRWLAAGHDVVIYTARVWPLGTHDEAEISYSRQSLDDLGFGGIAITRTERAMQAADQHFRVKAWCLEHIGQELPITCIKDPFIEEFWDDRAIGVIPNTGRRADDCGAGDSNA